MRLAGWMMVVAAPLVLTAPVAAQSTSDQAAASNPADVADTATGTAAWEKLKGNTITGKVTGQSFSEFFDPGGSVRYVDKDGLSTGTWSVQPPKVCFDFPDDDDRSCSVFTVTGSTGTVVDDDGTTVRFTIESGNSKGL